MKPASPAKRRRDFTALVDDVCRVHEERAAAEELIHVLDIARRQVEAPGDSMVGHRLLRLASVAKELDSVP